MLAYSSSNGASADLVASATHVWPFLSLLVGGPPLTADELSNANWSEPAPERDLDTQTDSSEDEDETAATQTDSSEDEDETAATETATLSSHEHEQRSSLNETQIFILERSRYGSNIFPH